MKHLKTYEEINKNEPEIGDYILTRPNVFESDMYMFINNFTNNNVGIITNVKISPLENKMYHVYYKNLPKEIKDILNTSMDYHFSFSQNDIQHWSKDKNKLETLISVNKYNL